jgi:hypothetical protein
MALELIGAGFGRTGTLSLKSGLERLGLAPCHHMMEVMMNPGQSEVFLAGARGEPVDWDSLFADYRATVDWPACAFWRELCEQYPDAPVLLSVRDPESWYESVSETIFTLLKRSLSSDDPEVQARTAMARELIYEGTFGGRIDDKDHVIEVFERHNAEVKATVPPERLLVYEVKQGWEPLCAFLGKPVPDEPFPRTNSTEEFKKRFGTT